MIDPTEFGKAMGAIVRTALEPLQKRIEELESRHPECGEKGEAGEPGRDADPLDGDAITATITAALLGGDGLKALVDFQIAESMAEYFEANPIQHGQDGRRGEKGDPGERGEKGMDGADGLDVKELFRADGGRLMAVMSDGTTKDLGQFVGSDGQPGKDGRDGQSAENFEREYLPEFHEIRERWTVGDQVKELKHPAGGIRYIGYWREGTEAKGNDATTHDGTLWVAIRDTKAKPCRESSDWYIGARKGRDGLTGPAGKAYVPPEPVKLS